MACSDIPLIVVLFEKRGFSGRQRVIVESIPDLQFQSFDDRANSIKVIKGPAYDDMINNGQEPRAALYRNQNYGGDAIILPVGEYSQITANRSSVQVVLEPWPPPVSPAQPKEVALVVYLYDYKSYGGKYITLIESSQDLATQFGFSNIASSMKICEGPNWNGETVTLYDGKHFGGKLREFEVGEYENLLADKDLELPNVNNIISSVKIGA